MLLFGFARLVDWFSYVKIISCHILLRQFESTMGWETIGLFCKVMQKQFTLVSSVLQHAKEQSPLLKETKKSSRSSLRHRDRGTVLWVTRASYSGKLSALVEVLQPFLKKGILYHFPLCWTRICLEALLDRLAPIPTMICATVKRECLMHGP